ncbi:universal stress protein [Natronolimnohabitans sp. A-GB9]|uniref:universal stress protein n=1 Tax=Natronolimnohabitans sp. A-GB9 TaxID=3069757 RepID=UPI0027B03306|nr:universal stress protein [Natronolimnohabitans sp. A-GB9]MDQ2052415.1 universal stress protein [Natronolimnohabitans sp. A-GB9]
MTDDIDQTIDRARENYQRILLPTDGSDEAQMAAERGIEIAAALDATVHAFSVIQSSAVLKRDQLRTDAKADARDAVERVETAAESAGVEVTTSVEKGVSHESIVNYATANDIDMIVMGTHGRTGLDHVMIGSVAERVVRTSPVPVLTIRPQE